MKRLVYWKMIRRMDWVMTLVVLILIMTGIVFIYSAGRGCDDPTLTTLSRRQIVWSAIGIVAFVGFALLDYHVLANVSWWLYVAGVMLLVMVLMPQIGHRMYGARRWLQIGGISVLQPSELMKLAIIILMARIFGWPDRRAVGWPLVISCLALVLLPVALIIKQPDLGTALILLLVFGAVILVAGTPVRIIGGLAAAALLSCALLVGVVLLPEKVGWSEEKQEKIWNTLGFSEYQRERLLVFFDSKRDPLGAGWSKAQSQIAVGSGGVWGKGYLEGTQNILGFLPRTVAPNDFIFSVIAEEKGFVGASMVLFLYAVLLGCVIRAAAFARDRVGMMMCAGVAAMLFCHVFVNVAMTIGLLPVTGTPLPLISYGGSFMLTVMIALGITQSVYIRGSRNRSGIA